MFFTNMHCSKKKKLRSSSYLFGWSMLTWFSFTFFVQFIEILSWRSIRFRCSFLFPKNSVNPCFHGYFFNLCFTYLDRSFHHGVRLSLSFFFRIIFYWLMFGAMVLFGALFFISSSDLISYCLYIFCSLGFFIYFEALPKKKISISFLSMWIWCWFLEVFQEFGIFVLDLLTNSSASWLLHILSFRFFYFKLYKKKKIYLKNMVVIIFLFCRSESSVSSLILLTI